MSRRMRLFAAPILVASTLLSAVAAHAQQGPDDHHGGGPRGEGPHAAAPHPGGPGPGPMHFDGRFHHDLFYPAIGWNVPLLPDGAISIVFGNGHFFFSGGVWFQPVGGNYVVVAPPPGIIVPMLPPAYTTLWVAGLLYYYANGVYYLADGPNGYRVVNPPSDTTTVTTVPAPKPAPDPIVYPRNGQSAAQTEIDQRACNTWATQQKDAMSDSSIFNRAVQACMDAHGYTVR
jgi:hypothetical protein